MKASAAADSTPCERCSSRIGRRAGPAAARHREPAARDGRPSGLRAARSAVPGASQDRPSRALPPNPRPCAPPAVARPTSAAPDGRACAGSDWRSPGGRSGRSAARSSSASHRPRCGPRSLDRRRRAGVAIKRHQALTTVAAVPSGRGGRVLPGRGRGDQARAAGGRAQHRARGDAAHGRGGRRRHLARRHLRGHRPCSRRWVSCCVCPCSGPACTSPIAGVLLAATIPARVRLDALTFVRSTQPIAGRWCRPQRRSPDSSGHGRLPRARRPSAIASASSMLTPKRRSV